MVQLPEYKCFCKSCFVTNSLLQILHMNFSICWASSFHVCSLILWDVMLCLLFVSYPYISQLWINCFFLCFEFMCIFKLDFEEKLFYRGHSKIQAHHLQKDDYFFCGLSCHLTYWILYHNVHTCAFWLSL